MAGKETRTTGSAEGTTRHKIMLALLKGGASTATDLAQGLKISAAGVRRHLDVLEREGLVETVSRRSAAAGRGRPPKYFQLADRGREAFGHTYDSLAELALSTLRSAVGEAAVRDLARRRIETILSNVSPARSKDPADVVKTVEELAHAFDAHGYAATVTAAGHGVQLCQHHCPVVHVAARHPALCVAERAAIAELTGQHVQLLASIVDGHGVCTTNIPLPRTTTTHQKGARS